MMLENKTLDQMSFEASLSIEATRHTKGTNDDPYISFSLHNSSTCA